jgi:mannose-6-phosphate isomerase-like protein (cupin superfamily)
VKTISSPNDPNADYSSVVVNKPWGYEYLAYQNLHVAAWILYIGPGLSTSLHCHVKKKTSLIVLSGQVITSTLDTRYQLAHMDAITIESCVFHSTRASPSEGAFVMEVETPPEKHDLVRLRDNFGRENSGYEAAHTYSRDLSAYRHVEFHGFRGESLSRTIEASEMLLCRLSQDCTLAERVTLEAEELLVSVGGALVNRDGSLLFNTGDVFRGEDILPHHSARTPGYLDLIRIHRVE